MVFYFAAAVLVAALVRIGFLWRALLRQLPDCARHLVLF